MSTRRRFALVGTVLLLLAVGVLALITYPFLSRRTYDVVITMERHGCFGVCPAYRLTIYGNGVVVYQGNRDVKDWGLRVEIIGEDQVGQLIAEFERADFFSLEDYDEYLITDLSGAEVSITIDGKSKTVEHYHGDVSAPASLFELENRIDEIVGSERWVGESVRYSHPSEWLLRSLFERGRRSAVGRRRSFFRG